ncbi:MAG: polysaccharide biosynthesis/export family protein [Pseudomonadota bacterium]
MWASMRNTKRFPRRGAALGALLGAAISLPLLLGGGAAASEAYRLSSGDALKITVFDEPKLSGDFTLDDAGVLSFPLVGDVAARGMTTSELEGALDRKLRGDYLVNPRIAIDVLSYKPFSILGEVKSPGRLPYAANLNVLDAVAMAGGFTLRANRNAIEITRGGATKDTFEARQETLILPGDIIRVRQRFF